jgi:hypothetical protein
LSDGFFKTLINLCVDGPLPIGRNSGTAGVPSHDLVEVACGFRAFQNCAGLYSIVRLGMQIESADILNFYPLIKNHDHIEGGLFSFRGFNYLLFLESEGSPHPIGGVFMGPEDLGDCQLNFHNDRIKQNEKGYLSQVVNISW